MKELDELEWRQLIAVAAAATLVCHSVLNAPHGASEGEGTERARAIQKSMACAWMDCIVESLRCLNNGQRIPEGKSLQCIMDICYGLHVYVACWPCVIADHRMVASPLPRLCS